MTLLILGLALIALILVVVLCAIYNSDIVEIKVEVTSTGKIKIKIIKRDKHSANHKKHRATSA